MHMSHPNLKDISGHRFGRLTVLFQSGNRPSGGALWRCVCECGSESVFLGGGLRRGKYVSCGCFRNERRTTHGQSRTALYKVWTGMKQRCSNPLAKHYESYGGRAISFCESWAEFVPFFDWASASGYKQGLTIDRIDVNIGYCSENCRWISQKEQALNKRRTMKNENGVPWSVIARENGLPESMFSHRVSHGWPMHLAATQPKFTRLKSALKQKTR